MKPLFSSAFALVDAASSYHSDPLRLVLPHLGKAKNQIQKQRRAGWYPTRRSISYEEMS